MAFRRFEILDVRLPSFLQHDATQIRILTEPNINDKDSITLEKLLIYKDAENKDRIIQASGVEKDNVIETDNRNLLNVFEFNLNFEEHDVYYVTYDIWHNDVTHAGWARPNMVTRDTDGYSSNDVEIITPKLQITTDPNNAELGGFTIKTSEFQTFIGTATHKFTTWIIEDYTGNVIWKRERDAANLTSIRIPNNILNIDSLYVIKAIHFSSSNVPSNPGKMIIKTKGELTEVEKILLATKVAAGTMTEVDKEVLNTLGASGVDLVYGNERPVITGGKDSLTDVSEALENSLNQMMDYALTSGAKTAHIKHLTETVEKLNGQLKVLKDRLSKDDATIKQLQAENEYMDTHRVPKGVFEKAMARVIELSIENALLKSNCNK